MPKHGKFERTPDEFPKWNFADRSSQRSQKIPALESFNSPSVFLGGSSETPGH